MWLSRKLVVVRANLTIMDAKGEHDTLLNSFNEVHTYAFASYSTFCGGRAGEGVGVSAVETA